MDTIGPYGDIPELDGLTTICSGRRHRAAQPAPLKSDVSGRLVCSLRKWMFDDLLSDNHLGICIGGIQ